MDKEPAVIRNAESLVKSGKFFEAYNSCYRGLINFPDNLRLHQLFGLSLARLGATQRAYECISRLYRKGHRDPETSGILGRIYKDMWRKTGDMLYARRSRDIYLTSFRHGKEYYPGINAATMSLIIGEKNRSRRIAGQVIENVKKSDRGYWKLAALGEAYLLRSDFEKSMHFYRMAVDAVDGNYGDVCSIYRQLVLLSDYIDIPQEIPDLFKPPSIICFTGHMIDRPGRELPRLPESAIPRLRNQMRKKLDELGARIGYSMPACGSDIVFIEEMLKRGAEVNIFLPFCIEDFIATSVAYAGKIWERKFRMIIKKARVHYVTEEKFLGNNELFSFANDAIMGIAYLQARMMHTNPWLLAVVDRVNNHSLPGSTLELVNKWPDKESIRLIELNPRQAVRNDASPPHGAAVSAADFKTDIMRDLKCILFSDIVGFSRIEEQYTPYFMHELLESIAVNTGKLPARPEIINTWGDAIFAVYTNAKDLAEFAFHIKDTFTGTDWSAKNLPRKISARIALHAGPVFIGTDSITKRTNAYGRHISRTAMMEPVTVPGCIYASSQFAAKLIMETGDLYRYEYAGEIELPKKYGRQEMFLLMRENEL